MKEFDGTWETLSKRSTCSFLLIQYLSHLLNARRSDWNINCIFGKEEFGKFSFVGSGFLPLGGGSLDKTFPNAKSLHLYTRKSLKKSHILTEEFWTLCFIPICLILASILFQFIFASFFLVRPSWGSHKSPRKSCSFFEFSRIIAYKISVDLVLLWCKFFVFLLPRSWLFLLLLPRAPRIFLDFFHDPEKSCKILRTLPRIIAKILGRNVKNPKNFFARKPRRHTLG